MSYDITKLQSEVARCAANIRWAPASEKARARAAYRTARAALQDALRPTITVAPVALPSVGDRVFAAALDAFLAGLAIAAPALALGVWA